MNGIRKPTVILADSMEEYMAMPDPYKEGIRKKRSVCVFLLKGIPARRPE